MLYSHSRRSGRGRRVSHLYLVCLMLVAMFLLAAVPARATTIYANPGDNLTTKVNSMSPGDTLIINPGTYGTLRITNKNGSPDAWFTIRGSDAGVACLRASSTLNVVEIRNSSYWRLENFEVDGRNTAGTTVGSDGIKAAVTTSGSNTDYYHHFVFEDLYVHHFLNNCFSSHVTGWDIVIRNCHFSDAQEVGLYMGNSDGRQPIMNFTFEHNLVERTGNYNMELKAQLPRIGVAMGTTPGLEFTTWGWLIKDNVWMRDNATVDANRPNFLIDAAPMSGVGSDDLATIEGNLVLGNATNAFVEHGFQLAGNLRVVNNIIVNIEGSGYAGIRVGQHQGIYPRRLEMLNNTVFLLDGSDNARCLSLFDLQAGYTQVIANNAFIRGNTAAVAVSGSYPAGAVVTNNIVRGTGALAGMTTITTPLDQIFVNPVETPGLANLYPSAGSPLIGAGTAHALMPDKDFNGVPRPATGVPVDVGAYRYYTTANPGWQLQIGLKGFWLAGDCTADRKVNVFDLQLLANTWNKQFGQAGFNTLGDFNGDNKVNVFDLQIMAQNWNATAP